MKELVPLSEETLESLLSGSVFHVRKQREVATDKPRRESSPEPNPTGALISEFQPPELSESQLLFFKPPGLWYGSPRR